MKKMPCTTKNAKGFTLVELMIVIVLGGLLIAVAIAAAPRIQASISANKDMATIPDITANVQAHFSLKSNFATLTNTIVTSYKLVPDDMITGAGVIANRHAGAVTLAPVTVSVANDSFSLSYGGVPSRVCLKVVPQLAPQYLALSINGTVVKPVGGVLDEATAATQCDNAVNTLLFTASK